MDHNKSAQGELSTPLALNPESSAKEALTREKLIQRINYSHFQNRPLFVYLRHRVYDEGLHVAAYPTPLKGDLLTLTLSYPPDISEREEFEISKLLIPCGDGIITVPVAVIDAGPDSATVKLGEPELNSRRQGPRHTGLGIGAEITQNAFITRGNLVDFGGGNFLVRVNTENARGLRWLNPEENVTMKLFNDETPVFAEECRLIREKRDHFTCDLAFASIKESIKRFPARSIRNPRKEIVPAPQVQFLHPLTGKKIYREIANISTSGFSIQENQREETLFPGLILPQVVITSGGIIRMKCSAQVIFRRRQGNLVTFGLAILDMEIRAFSALSHIITNNGNPRACVSTELDMDELWEFLFDTDFIYPAKYHEITKGRENIKETFRRLYEDNLEISRHFTYEKNGFISAHIAMLRAYERAWMIHHFAARPLESRLTGFIVLRQLLIFLNGFYRLPSASMDYILTYYQPANRIIERIFGGFAGHINDLQACSQDLFAYFRFSPNKRANLTSGWSLRESAAADLRLLKRFYDDVSGGLMVEALNLAGRKSPNLEGAYETAGFTRHCLPYTLCQGGRPAALIIVNHSPPGLNLSELPNCLKVIILSPEELPLPILTAALTEAAQGHPLDNPPVMVYPAGYVEGRGIEGVKNYQLWILNAAAGIPFLEYLERKFRLKVG